MNWLIVALSIPIVLAVALGVVWMVYLRVGMRWGSEMAPLPRAGKNDPIDDVEACEFKTSDGLTLRGNYLPTHAAERTGVIAFCHELAGNRWGAVPYVQQLRNLGFDVFTFDFRNHGASEKVAGYDPGTLLTKAELFDVRAAIDYLCNREGADPRGIALFGVSKGACCALYAAARDKRVWAVVAEGAFSTEWMAGYYVRRYMHIASSLAPIFSRAPWFLIQAYGKFIQRVLAKRRGINNVYLLKEVGKIKQPVLLIHGERDGYVPVDMARKLRRRVGRNCKLWVVSNARHADAVEKAQDKYLDRTTRFFLKSSNLDRPLRPVDGSDKSSPRERTDSRDLETAAL